MFLGRDVNLKSDESVDVARGPFPMTDSRRHRARAADQIAARKDAAMAGCDPDMPGIADALGLAEYVTVAAFIAFAAPPG